jgi:hypothetical protein
VPAGSPHAYRGGGGFRGGGGGGGGWHADLMRHLADQGLEGLRGLLPGGGAHRHAHHHHHAHAHHRHHGYAYAGGHGGARPAARGDDNVDIDGMTREQILALTESIGTVRVGLTRRQLATLPTHTYRAPRRAAGDSSADEAPAAETCVICCCELEDGDEVRTLPCSHGFHRGCIDKWLLSDAFGAKSCPVCITEVKV